MSPRRVDANQVCIVQTIKSLGGGWIETSADPRAGCDGILLYKGRAYPVEIKNGAMPPSKRKLTPNEQETQKKCAWRGVPYLILTSVDETIEVLKGLTKGG